ncbi:TPA: hypothetical protein DD449_04300 [Candidatus Berkelbacteria bacterium]|uniref:Uncharacterized protein n=1 Tax=Berkelbacteria bacterium GW2011_GWE1_39_12 TaxID=1618337 RepID=A0A0G4B404_9BACT|nr:MAG: hypothetical protein UT28_C0001G0480 [Berkelbacteria bacterium GW2011_GWE1_39_12]HBO60876.1 hypothetical protein [Candidatus Berkelbacteria bacterium]
MAHVMVKICMDPRYRPGGKYEKPLEHFLISIGAEGAYQVSEAGASLQYAKLACEPALLDRLKTARDAGVKRYILIDHLTCKAFPLHFPGLKPEDEKKKHLETLGKARQWHELHAPDISFEMYLQDDEDPYHFERIS